jgi:hypothetical protein
LSSENIFSFFPISLPPPPVDKWREEEGGRRGRGNEREGGGGGERGEMGKEKERGKERRGVISCVCFITAGPITKLFAWGGEESGGHVLWDP